MKRSHSLQNKKYRFCFCGVPVFPSAICLSAGFSLFNQSNMKQEIWSLPRDVHPSEAAGKTTAQLSRAPRLSEAGATSAPLVEWRGILGLWGIFISKIINRDGDETQVTVARVIMRVMCLPNKSVLLFVFCRLSEPLSLLFSASCLLALDWAIPAIEISCSSNPLIRVSHWDYHPGQPRRLPPPPTLAIVEPVFFFFFCYIRSCETAAFTTWRTKCPVSPSIQYRYLAENDFY